MCNKIIIIEPFYFVDDEVNVHYEEFVRLYKAVLLELPYKCLPDYKTDEGVSNLSNEKWIRK